MLFSCSKLYLIVKNILELQSILNMLFISVYNGHVIFKFHTDDVRSYVFPNGE